MKLGNSEKVQINYIKCLHTSGRLKIRYCLERKKNYTRVTFITNYLEILYYKVFSSSPLLHSGPENLKKSRQKKKTREIAFMAVFPVQK